MTAVDKVAARCLDHDVADLNTGWEDVLVPLGLTLAGQTHQDERMLDWARRWADYHLAVEPHHTGNIQGSGEPNRGIYLTRYCGEWGAASVFAALHEAAPDESLLAAAVRIADHICDHSVRLDDGTIAHAESAKAPWVDTLYYTAAPLARVHQATKDERYATEAIRQCLLHAHHLRDERTGCFCHDVDPATGTHPGWLWSRGNGWVVMSFADVLRSVPPDTQGWNELRDLYRDLAAGLLRYQHSCGLWRIVPEDDESHLETSGSTMIATGLAVGVAERLLDDDVAGRVRRAWAELVTWVDDDGAVQGCQSPAGLGGWERHKLSALCERTYGNGSFLRLAAELRTAGLIGADQ